SDGRWRVTALIGIAEGAAVPDLVVDGRRCPAPLELLRHQQQQFLRYDLSCPCRADGRRIEYGWADGSARWEFSVPAQGSAPRMAYVSCNGFSDPAEMRK